MILDLTSSQVSLRDHRLVLSETVDANILLSLVIFFFKWWDGSSDTSFNFIIVRGGYPNFRPFEFKELWTIQIEIFYNGKVAQRVIKIVNTNHIGGNTK